MKKMDKNICIRIDRNADQIKGCQEFLKIEESFILRKSKFLSLIGNNIRFSIMLLLNKEKRLCVCDLAEMLSMKIPAISQHLRKMKDAQIVKSNREGTVIYYKISSEFETEFNIIINAEYEIENI